MKKLFTILLLFNYCLATDYYVRTDGSNSNNGLANTPGGAWLTLAYATANTTSGDIIHVNTGTYTETTQSVLAAGVSIEGDGYATTKIFTTLNIDYSEAIRLYQVAEGVNGNQHISGIFFDGGNDLNLSRCIWVRGRNNVAIYDCKFENYMHGVIFDGRTDNSAAAPTIYATGNTFHDNIMNNCSYYFSGAYGSGCLNVGGQDGMTIYNNTITQNQRTITPVNLNGWPLKYSTGGYLKNLVVHDNVFVKNEFLADYPGAGDWGFTVELWHVEGGLVMYNNTSNAEWDLVQVRKRSASFGAHIYNNTFSFPTLQTKNIKGIDFELGGQSIIVENNTFTNFATGILMQVEYFPDDVPFWEAFTLIEDVVIRNNLFKNLGYTAGNGNNGAGVSIPQANRPDATFTLTNFKVYNNTFIAAAGNAAQLGVHFNFYENVGTINNIEIKNNIFQGFDMAHLRISNFGTTSFTGLHLDNNDYYSNGNGNNPILVDGTPSGYTYTNNITGNPNFQETTNYTLNTSTSPCIDAGTNVGISYNGTAPDIGYWESGTASSGYIIRGLRIIKN